MSQPPRSRRRRPPNGSLHIAGSVDSCSSDSRHIQRYDFCQAMLQGNVDSANVLDNGAPVPEGVYARFIYEVHGTASLEQLEKACRLLIQNNEILRTRFSITVEPERAVGVISSDDTSAQFLYFDVISGAEAHWKTFKKDYLDQRLAEFCFVVSEVHRDLYNGKQPDPGPPFSQFAEYLSRNSVSPACEHFWREKLMGSKPTVIGSGSSVSMIPDGCFVERVTAPSRSQFTFAVILYTAWALSLRNTTRNQDVTFFGSVSGRNMSFHRSANVVGPCINVIPTCVKLHKCRTIYH
ncbi:hypothetical protein N7468_003953 [Penicillium chermesinum]|uniref:Condensation domain-containing protein n=1 Tax=Penicillium chermesinum TaxID=63820 RepID=A0A9W9TTV7_9EURO|nr:uncharacterized protein N7468_003953 [Penicillium chermesinum]KAJ5239334.1 hypothetical protein N7468_003953 [Penicillium chermesinum]